MFYLSNLFFVVYSLFLYAWFRCGIYDYFRVSGRSKTFINKNRQGLKNYWLYTQLHAQCPLGVRYPLNCLFLFVLIVYSVLTLSLGYLPFLRIPIRVLAILLGCVQLPALLSVAKYEALAKFDRPFVLFEREKQLKKGMFSSLYYGFAWVGSLILLHMICTVA